MDVVCVGECLVDFLPAESGRGVRDVTAWRPAIGGSLANVSVGVARLGGRSAYVGVVGEDEFGHFLRERLAAEGVDVSHLRQTAEAKTGLVFISLDARGERSFTYFRTRSAEFLLSERDVDPAFLGRARVVHFGTNSLKLPEARAAMLRTVDTARSAGRIVSCDPNLRLHAWEDPEVLRALLGQLLPRCSVVKLSEEEVAFATGHTAPEEALRYLAGLGVTLPVVTRGEAGAVFLWRGEVVRVPAPQVRVVDTTGAGDGFMAGFLRGLSRRYANASELAGASREDLESLAAFSCAVGSRVVEHLGAVTGLPGLDAVASALPWWLRGPEV
ncbi:carbohydrate kinase [Vitiosangium sp. GDMCC 1.1324]|uniref:carbohydrate kinase family protein n=1 Tax=Vitiosangium sp. (strain GDMCC 1.1324) TaxID=2138576 RepID=UPI000D3BC44E|nr:carbohydrate kinase [Vitiosangium sp. GDMCC 1.1324]PTL76324.1 carbohydrate kinase [Vitiosangium sp. GDMCC 1.1324]